MANYFKYINTLFILSNFRPFHMPNETMQNWCGMCNLDGG